MIIVLNIVLIILTFYIVRAFRRKNGLSVTTIVKQLDLLTGIEKENKSKLKKRNQTAKVFSSMYLWLHSG